MSMFSSKQKQSNDEICAERLEKCRSIRDKRTLELNKATKALDDARAASTAARKEDLSQEKLDKFRRARIEAECDCEELTAVIAELDVEIANLEAKQRAAEDAKVRERTSRELHRRADAGEKLVKPLVDALTTLQTWLKDDVVNVTGSVGMAEIVDRLLSDDKYNPGLGPAVKIFADQLRARAADITRGAGLPTLPVPFVPQVVEKQKPGPTIEVYALQHLRWKQTAPGELCSADAFHIVALPSHYAKLALERSLALPPDHPRVQEMVRNKHGPSAGVPRSVDLDEDPNMVSVYEFGTGKHLRDELPGANQPFQNYRANEPVKKVWVSRPEPQPEPGSSDPNSGIFDDPA